MQARIMQAHSFYLGIDDFGLCSGSIIELACIEYCNNIYVFGQEPCRLSCNPTKKISYAMLARINQIDSSIAVNQTEGSNPV